MLAKVGSPSKTQAERVGAGKIRQARPGDIPIGTKAPSECVRRCEWPACRGCPMSRRCDSRWCCGHEAVDDLRVGRIGRVHAVGSPSRVQTGESEPRSCDRYRSIPLVGSAVATAARTGRSCCFPVSGPKTSSSGSPPRAPLQRAVPVAPQIGGQAGSIDVHVTHKAVARRPVSEAPLFATKRPAKS